MDLESRYGKEAPTPTAPTFEEAFAYFFNEQRRRAYNSTDGLTNDDLNHDPGHGSWSIGQILAHQLHLLRFMAETIEPGATADTPNAPIGEPGAWNIEAIVPAREQLWDQLQAVFQRATPETLMQTRPQMPPEHWAQWPVFMRVMRPLIDYATHIGQVNYARRQLGKPVKRV